jgi:hypothetical protein
LVNKKVRAAKYAVRKWISLFETALNNVTGEDVRDLYVSAPSDLHVLLDDGEDDWGTLDWGPDTERWKKFLSQYAGRELILYRWIKGRPDTENLGIHWSMNPDINADFGGTLITARVHPNAVDWVGTVARAIHFWEDEEEITLFREMPIDIIGIKDDLENEDVSVQGTT